jgi:hypothetical protein
MTAKLKGDWGALVQEFGMAAASKARHEALIHGFSVLPDNTVLTYPQPDTERYGLVRDLLAKQRSLNASVEKER